MRVRRSGARRCSASHRFADPVADGRSVLRSAPASMVVGVSKVHRLPAEAAKKRCRSWRTSPRPMRSASCNYASGRRGRYRLADSAPTTPTSTGRHPDRAAQRRRLRRYLSRHRSAGAADRPRRRRARADRSLARAYDRADAHRGSPHPRAPRVFVVLGIGPIFTVGGFVLYRQADRFGRAARTRLRFRMPTALIRPKRCSRCNPTWS